MWLFSFYRLYSSIALGSVAYLFIYNAWWFGLCATIAARLLWAVAERGVNRIKVQRAIARHASAFKQQLGPYGIRMINKAEKDAAVARNLAEVFTDNEKRLRKTVEQLEMMDTLFRAGMRPDGETQQLHDLKLKYGKYRIEEIEKKRSSLPVAAN